MKKIILTVLLTFFCAFFVSSVSAATYYVSPTGNDLNTATQAQNISTPWRTIQKAASTLNSGNTVIVSAGTYNETVSVSRSGIIFQTNGVVTMKGFYITGNNTTVTGFRVNDSPENGIEVRGSNSIIKNNTVTRARNAGIFIAGQNNLIENNDISRIIQPKPHSQGGDANCFTFFGGGHTFKGNYCHDIYSDGVLVTDAHIDAFQTWNWASLGGVGHDTLFEKNLLMYPINGKGWNLEEGAYNITIKNNVVLANLIVLIIDGNNISFLSNTFVGISNTSDGLHIRRTSVNMYNNIFAHQKQRVIENLESSSTIAASNNCYMDYGIILPANPGDVRTTNALFVNESSRDYHLQSGSPCINKGTTISAVTDDKDGVSRPQGSSYDMGAYEYIGSACIPNCTGKACGDDGCGSSCGSCSINYSCINFQCVAPTPTPIPPTPTPIPPTSTPTNTPTPTKTPTPIPPTPTPNPIGGNTYYVSPTGNDTNSGTQTSPWKTIQKAANTVVAGDTVNVRSGTYLEVITIDKSGTSMAPITFKNYSNEIPIIDGRNLPSGTITDLLGPLVMINSNYIVFSGFTVRNSPGQGIKNKGAYNIISNNNINNIIREGLQDSNGHDTTYQDNEVWNSALRYANQDVSGGWPCAVSYYGSSNHNKYLNNYIHNNHGEGLCTASYNQLIGNTVKDNWSVDIYLDQANNVLVSNNLIIESETSYTTTRNLANGISIADEVSCSQSNNTITNNIIIGAKTGINYYQYQSCSGLKSALIQNNTFVNIWNYGIRIVQGNNSNNIFRNNIFYIHQNTNGGEIAQSILFERPNDSIFENNLFYNPSSSSTNQFNWSGSTYDFAGWQNISTNIKNNIWADPLFKNIGQLDPDGAQLTAGSQAIDTGYNLNSLVTNDFDGNTRPQGAGYDIGAYEFIGTPVTSTPTPPACIPNCTGKACGDDGCGSSCGSCSIGQNCINFQCVAPTPTPIPPTPTPIPPTPTPIPPTYTPTPTRTPTPVPPTPTRTPTPAPTLTPTPIMTLTPIPPTPTPTIPVCIPNCTSKACGDDECGSSCGSCDVNQSCINFQCMAPISTPTNTPIPLPTDTPIPLPTDTPTPTPTIPVCNPSCTGKACGDDGCGSSCGSCEISEVCKPDYTCGIGEISLPTSTPIPTDTPIPLPTNTPTPGPTATLTPTPIRSVPTPTIPVCIPNCTNKACGSDGCGSSCGSCQALEICKNDYTCGVGKVPSNIPTAIPTPTYTIMPTPTFHVSFSKKAKPSPKPTEKIRNMNQKNIQEDYSCKQGCTLSAWINFRSKTTNQPLIMGKYDQTPIKSEYLITYSKEKDLMQFKVFSENEEGYVDNLSFGSPPINSWIFVITWYDPVEQTINTQINNGQVNSQYWRKPLNITSASFVVAGQNFKGSISKPNFQKTLLNAEERSIMYNKDAGLYKNMHPMESVLFRIISFFKKSFNSVTLR